MMRLWLAAELPGCATALALQCQGFRSIILERSDPAVLRVGEHLPPDARLLLGQLGLWSAFVADQHLPCPGVRAPGAAPASTSVNTSSVLMVTAGTWIGGASTPRWSRRCARQVARCATTRVGTITAQEHGWSVEAVIAGQPQVLTAAFLVDATGRAATVARKLGGRRPYTIT